MFRAFFLALGLYASLLGVECLLIDKAVLASGGEQTTGGVLAQHIAPGYRDVVPPEWAPWSLMSGGAVVMLYSFTLPQKMKA